MKSSNLGPRQTARQEGQLDLYLGGQSLKFELFVSCVQVLSFALQRFVLLGMVRSLSCSTEMYLYS